MNFESMREEFKKQSNPCKGFSSKFFKCELTLANGNANLNKDQKEFVEKYYPEYLSVGTLGLMSWLFDVASWIEAKGITDREVLQETIYLLPWQRVLIRKQGDASYAESRILELKDALKIART